MMYLIKESQLTLIDIKVALERFYKEIWQGFFPNPEKIDITKSDFRKQIVEIVKFLEILSKHVEKTIKESYLSERKLKLYEAFLKEIYNIIGKIKEIYASFGYENYIEIIVNNLAKLRKIQVGASPTFGKVMPTSLDRSSEYLQEFVKAKDELLDILKPLIVAVRGVGTSSLARGAIGTNFEEIVRALDKNDIQQKVRDWANSFLIDPKRIDILRSETFSQGRAKEFKEITQPEKIEGWRETVGDELADRYIEAKEFIIKVVIERTEISRVLRGLREYGNKRGWNTDWITIAKNKIRTLIIKAQEDWEEVYKEKVENFSEKEQKEKSDKEQEWIATITKMLKKQEEIIKEFYEWNKKLKDTKEQIINKLRMYAEMAGARRWLRTNILIPINDIDYTARRAAKVGESIKKDFIQLDSDFNDLIYNKTRVSYNLSNGITIEGQLFDKKWKNLTSLNEKAINKMKKNFFTFQKKLRKLNEIFRSKIDRVVKEIGVVEIEDKKEVRENLNKVIQLLLSAQEFTRNYIKVLMYFDAAKRKTASDNLQFLFVTGNYNLAQLRTPVLDWVEKEVLDLQGLLKEAFVYTDKALELGKELFEEYRVEFGTKKEKRADFLKEWIEPNGTLFKYVVKYRPKIIQELETAEMYIRNIKQGFFGNELDEKIQKEKIKESEEKVTEEIKKETVNEKVDNPKEAISILTQIFGVGARELLEWLFEKGAEVLYKTDKIKALPAPTQKQIVYHVNQLIKSQTPIKVQSLPTREGYSDPIEWAYAVFKLPKEATANQVIQKYRELSRVYHPDKGGTKEDMQRVNEAFNVLKTKKPAVAELFEKFFLKKGKISIRNIK